MSEETFRLIEGKQDKIPLQESGTTLVAWSKEALPVVGRASVLVEFKGQKVKLPLLVVKRQGNSLLGRNWFRPLGIGLHGIQQLKVEDVTSRFSEVFRSDVPGFNGPPVHIELKDDAKPAFLKSRPVPLAQGRLAKEVDRLVQQGVWEPVEYSNWATPLVVVRKKDRTLRLCGDYRSTVKKAAKTSGYPLPTAAEILLTFGSSKIFTKLDLAQAYQQLWMMFQPRYSQLTQLRGCTRSCDCRLEFLTTWVFQRVIDTLLTGIPGVRLILMIS